MPGLVRGVVRYNVPDLSIPPEERGLFSGPAHKSGEDVEVDLYDPDTAPELVQGPEGLDVQGFTYVKHRSSLDEDEWLTGHNDYTLRGLKRTARYCRKDITAAAEEALDAEDNDTEPPKRYAAYSVWRPIKCVERDPLAVADWRTTDVNTLQASEYRATSNVTASGEYMLELLTQSPMAKDSGQKWYCKPNQEPDDVLILKFADTMAEKDSKIAGGCVHCSPALHEVSSDEPRMSVEARVMAFW